MNSSVLRLRLQAGGSLHPGRHIYIERPQDAELLRLLLDGEYCSVLTPRQMGKSSLMARTALALAKQGVRFAVIELAGGVGSSKEAEEWYITVLKEIVRSLQAAFDVQTWWNALAIGTHNQKLLRFFREIAGHIDGHIVIFFDEIDATLELSYANDLFAAIRTMYNERPFVSAYEKITICLLGVATPNELIKRRRTTPYNIGRTIHLRDFSEGEDDLSPLVGELNDDPEVGRAILRRILYWTDGHPYLTVKFCEELVRSGVRRPEDVDLYVERGFSDLDRLGSEVHFQDILRFLASRTSDRLATLSLYERILHGARERDQADLAHAQLKLSGLVKRNESGCLIVRNRLYQKLFDTRWIKSAKPKPAPQLANGVVVVSFLILLTSLAISQLRLPETLTLAPGRAEERELTPGEVHHFSLPLRVGQFLQLTINQQGIDVIATLFDPQGRELVEMDSANGTNGPERILALAQASGLYALKLRALHSEGKPGLYRIEIGEVRVATEVDRARVEAQHALDQGKDRLRSGSPEISIQHFKRALELYQRLGDYSGQNDAIHLLGGVYRSLGREQEALAIYGRAMPLQGQEAVTRFRQGELLLDLGRTEEALANFRRAYELWLRSDDTHQAALALRAFGDVHAKRGEFQLALRSYDQALELWRKRGEFSEEATLLVRRSEVLHSLGETEGAVDNLQHALDIYFVARNPQGQAVVLNSLGLLYASSGDQEQALEVFQQALNISREMGDIHGEAVALANVGNIHTKTDPSRALIILRKANGQFRQRRDRDREAKTLNDIGAVYDSLSQPAEALVSYRLALKLWREIGDPVGEADALLGTAQAERKLGHPDSALENVQGAIDIIERLRVQLGDLSLRSSYYAGLQRYFDFYIDLLMDLHESRPSAGYDAAALRASEMCRARSLLEALSEVELKRQAGVDPRLLRQRRVLEDRINAKEAQRLRAAGQDRSQEERRLEKELTLLLEEYQETLVRIRVANPRYATLTQPIPLSAREIQTTVLDRDTILLEYKLGTKRSFLWVVTPTAIHSFVLPERDLVEETARRAYQRLSRRQTKSGGDDSALAALSGMLLRPATHFLESKRLLIVSEGALDFIPFAALPSPNSSFSVPLTTTNEIVSMPSASTLAVLRRELSGRPPAPGALAVLADPVFENETALTPLPFAKEEARAIASLVPSGQSLLATGLLANRDTVFSGDLARYKIVHFATHGILNSRRPELSALALSQVDENGKPKDGFLRSYEIYNLNLPSELVVLSAGQTALGKEIRGEGLMTMTRGFMYAGARRVVASLWEIDDRATAVLMARFYQEMLQKGRRPAQALRLAQISMLQVERWRDPYYWAGFVFQGEWN